VIFRRKKKKAGPPARPSRTSHLPSNRRVRPSQLPPELEEDAPKPKKKAPAKKTPRPESPAKSAVDKPPKKGRSVAQDAAEGTASKEALQRKKRKKRPLVSPRAKLWLGRFSLVTGIIVVVCASVLVAWGLRRYMRNSPRFALRKVLVEGHQRRTPQQLSKAGGLEVGRNVFAIDEAQAASAIESDPWVEKASVHRELPNTMRVEVVEREPRALATVAGRLYLVDGQGEIFKEYQDGDPSDMPVVSGVTEGEIGKDREAVRRRLRRALDLVADLEVAKIADRFPVQEVAVTPDLAMRVTIGTDGITLVFGPPPHRAKIAKAARILEELRYRKVKNAVLFLDNKAHPERVVVRMR